MKDFKLSILVGIILLVISQAGCYYDKIPSISGVDFKVSFTADVIPIFNKSCNMSGCHASGGIKPDLTPVKAFNELSAGGYVTPGNPEKSVLSEVLNGTRSLMPPSGKLPNKDISLILGWIEQGALNN